MENCLCDPKEHAKTRRDPLPSITMHVSFLVSGGSASRSGFGLRPVRRKGICLATRPLFREEQGDYARLTSVLQAFIENVYGVSFGLRPTAKTW